MQSASRRRPSTTCSATLENVQAARYPDRILLCDRGTIDGAVYWPGSPDDFFSAMGTTQAEELARYDAVLFFESAAVGGLDIEGGNPTRIESAAEALDLDGRLRAIWSRHPRFVVVQHDESFFKKITLGLAAIERMVSELTKTTRAS